MQDNATAHECRQFFWLFSAIRTITFVELLAFFKIGSAGHLSRPYDSEASAYRTDSI